MSLCQTQAREGQESANVGTDSCQPELHCQLGHWDTEDKTQRNKYTFVKRELTTSSNYYSNVLSSAIIIK